ncbi:MAG: apolipoprotein N-acyltransferase [Planctomycetia bacterium]|nr:apolipoprotein N-acyltransferase [Planctomycetia bacterium]
MPEHEKSAAKQGSARRVSTTNEGMTISSLSPLFDENASASHSNTELAPTSLNTSARRIRTIAGQVSIELFLPILSGALLALCFMPPPAGILAWVALVPFAAAISRARGTAELYLGTYLGGVLFHLHTLDVIRTRLGGCGVFESRTAEWLLHGCIAALVWPLTLYLARQFARGVQIGMSIGLPVIWISSEFLRQELGWIVTWSPFPWLQLGTTQASYLHMIQVADLGGVWAVVGVVAAVNGALFDAMASRRLKPLVIGLVVVAAAWLYGEFRLRETAIQQGPSVALMPDPIQPAAVVQQIPKVDVLLWTETAYRETIDEPMSENTKALEACAQSTHSTLIVGCYRRQTNLRYNSAAIVDPKAGYLGCYDKCFLVPWSEFTPWSWTSPSENDTRNLTPGTTRPVFAAGKFTCGVSICYDACFDRLYRGFSPKPDFFAACSRETADITGYAARAILDMTRLRAVENRRAFVRNVDGGFSGVVSSTGEFTAAPDRPWGAPVSVGRIPIDRRATLAALAGNWLPISCCLVVVVVLVRSWRRI